jgi:hypothetical protein
MRLLPKASIDTAARHDLVTAAAMPRRDWFFSPKGAQGDRPRATLP